MVPERRLKQQQSTVVAPVGSTQPTTRTDVSSEGVGQSKPRAPHFYTSTSFPSPRDTTSWLASFITFDFITLDDLAGKHIQTKIVIHLDRLNESN